MLDTNLGDEHEELFQDPSNFLRKTDVIAQGLLYGNFTGWPPMAVS